MTGTTPQSLARHLATYITCDDTIICHVKRDFGYQMTLAELRRIKTHLPMKARDRGYIHPAHSVQESHIGRTFTPNVGEDRLLKALAAYHYKRAETDAQKKHWWRLM